MSVAIVADNSLPASRIVRASVILDSDESDFTFNDGQDSDEQILAVARLSLIDFLRQAVDMDNGIDIKEYISVEFIQPVVEYPISDPAASWNLPK